MKQRGEGEDIEGEEDEESALLMGQASSERARLRASHPYLCGKKKELKGRCRGGKHRRGETHSTSPWLSNDSRKNSKRISQKEKKVEHGR